MGKIGGVKRTEETKPKKTAKTKRESFSSLHSHSPFLCFILSVRGSLSGPKQTITCTADNNTHTHTHTHNAFDVRSTVRHDFHSQQHNYLTNAPAFTDESIRQAIERKARVKKKGFLENYLLLANPIFGHCLRSSTQLPKCMKMLGQTWAQTFW